MTGRDLQRAKKTAARKVEDRIARQMARIAELEAEVKAWRKRFPMCSYDPYADGVFCESRPE